MRLWSDSAKISARERLLRAVVMRSRQYFSSFGPGAAAAPGAAGAAASAAAASGVCVPAGPMVVTSVAARRAAKARLFVQLKDDYLVLKQSWGGFAGYDRFFAEPLSNAHLASIATYTDFVPAFRALLAREKTFTGFYAAARKLAALEKAERHRRLKVLCCAAPIGGG